MSLMAHCRAWHPCSARKMHLSATCMQDRKMILHHCRQSIEVAMHDIKFNSYVQVMHMHHQKHTKGMQMSYQGKLMGAFGMHLHADMWSIPMLHYHSQVLPATSFGYLLCMVKSECQNMTVHGTPNLAISVTKATYVLGRCLPSTQAHLLEALFLPQASLATSTPLLVKDKSLLSQQSWCSLSQCRTCAMWLALSCSFACMS